MFEPTIILRKSDYVCTPDFLITLKSNNHNLSHFWSSYSVHIIIMIIISLQWRHNGRDSVSNHQPHGCLLNRLFRRRSKKTSKLRVTGLCGTGEFSVQMASNAENVSIWWLHHVRSALAWNWVARRRPSFLCMGKMCLIFKVWTEISRNSQNNMFLTHLHAFI